MSITEATSILKMKHYLGVPTFSLNHVNALIICGYHTVTSYTYKLFRV